MYVNISEGELWKAGAITFIALERPQSSGTNATTQHLVIILYVPALAPVK